MTPHLWNVAFENEWLCSEVFFLRGRDQMSWQGKIEGLSCSAALVGLSCVMTGQLSYPWVLRGCPPPGTQDRRFERKHTRPALFLGFQDFCRNLSHPWGPRWRANISMKLLPPWNGVEARFFCGISEHCLYLVYFILDLSSIIAFLA